MGCGPGVWRAGRAHPPVLSYPQAVPLRLRADDHVAHGRGDVDCVVAAGREFGEQIVQKNA